MRKFNVAAVGAIFLLSSVGVSAAEPIRASASTFSPRMIGGQSVTALAQGSVVANAGRRAVGYLWLYALIAGATTMGLVAAVSDTDSGFPAVSP